MKLDPKYFNLFIACCALVAVLLIAYGSVVYHQNQEKRFLENVEQTDLAVYSMSLVTGADTLRISSLEGRPVVIHFWSTWSGKSRNVHLLLHDITESHPDLTVVAAAVRDDDQLIRDYIRENDHPFIYVEGTDLYHDLQVPGVPSLILLDRTGRFFSFQIGEDDRQLTEKIEALIIQEHE